MERLLMETLKRTDLVGPFVLANDEGQVMLFESLDALIRYEEEFPCTAYDSAGYEIRVDHGRQPKWYELGRGDFVVTVTGACQGETVHALLEDALESYREVGLSVPDVQVGASLRERLLAWARVVGYLG